MNQETINTVLEAEKDFLYFAKNNKLEVNKWALGYSRYASFPFDTMKNVKESFIIVEKTITDLCNFLGSLTDQEFLNWLKVN